MTLPTDRYNTPKLKVVATKGYNAIANSISGVPTGEAIDYIAPQAGMLTNQGLIQQVIINGAGSGVVCLCVNSPNGGLQPSGYFRTDTLLVWSGVAVQFGWNGRLPGSGLIGHVNSTAIRETYVQNRQIGYFAAANGPQSFTLPKPGE